MHHRMDSASHGRLQARGTALLALLLALDACMVGPDFKRPEAPVSKTWSVHDDPRISNQTATDSLWWKAFHDPTLDRLIALAYRQNLTLQVAGLRIVEARAQLGFLSGTQFPQQQFVSGSINAIGLPNSFAKAFRFDRNSVNYQAGFDAVWELDFWGKYRRGVEAGAASLLATVADYYAAVVSLTAEVARVYAVIRTFEVLVAQAEENVHLQEEALRIAEARFKNGATSELDVTQATTLLESTRASIPKLQISAQQSRNALNTLLGQPAGLEVLLAGAKDIPTAPARVAVSVPAEVLRRRPDIRSAELAAAAQCARIGVAKADLYPSFSLSGTIGLFANSTRGTFFSADSLTYMAGPQISWPFFNYGRITNSIRVEDARFQQLLVGYRNAVLKAAQEVEDALSGFLRSQEAMVFERRSVESAQRSQEIAVVQYREGAVDFERVLDAQRVLLQQQNNLAQTRSSVVTNAIALYKALGGGWQLAQGRPVVPEATRHEMQDRTSWGDLLSEPRAPEREANPPPRTR